MSARATSNGRADALPAASTVDGLLADVARSSRDGIAVVAGDQIEWVNGPLVLLLGLPAHELVGRTLDDILVEVLGPFGEGARLDLTALGDGAVLTGNLIPPDGAPVPVSVESATLGVRGDGRKALTFRRVSPLLRAQAAARSAEERFEAVATFAPVGVFHSDQGVRLDLVNLRFADLWSAPADSLLGIGWLDRVHPKDQPNVLATLERTLAGQVSACELRVVGPPVRSLRLHVVPVVRPDRSMGFVGTVDEVVGAGSGREREIQIGLREVLDNRGPDLAYQPIVSTSTGRLAGAEALLRFSHALLGPIPATEAIAVAERSGDVLDLGRQVVSAACRDLAAWRSAGVAPAYVAVNMSALQLGDPTFAQHVLRELAANSLAGPDLCLELTETQVMSDPEAAAPLLAGLREHGIRIALDDFGTGQSSLAYLRHLPVDLLKLDRSYLATPDAASASIVRAITTVAAALGCDVVAEGIETDAQLGWVRDLGCSYAQGFALGRPMPFADFALELP